MFVIGTVAAGAILNASLLFLVRCLRIEMFTGKIRRRILLTLGGFTYLIVMLLLGMSER